MNVKERNKIIAVFAFVLAFSVEMTFSQTEYLIDLSGIIRNVESQPMPFVNVKVKGKDMYTTTDMKGMFNLVGQKGDTIVFTAVGYHKRRLVLADSLDKMYYSADIVMFPDTVMLDPVMIFPWKTYAEFKKAFAELHLPVERDAELARRNIEIIKYQALTSVTPNAEVNTRAMLNNYAISKNQKGMAPYISLMNPIAWARFFQGLSDGSIVNSRDLKPVDEE